MSFQPASFLGRPLPELLAELDRANPDDLFEGQVELHSLHTKPFEPVTVRPNSMMATTVAESDLPADHPDVDVPGVALETYLGGGGQGWVYAGRVRDTGHIVAVKVLRADAITAKNSAAREALLCARLRHRNILRIFQAKPAGAFWVVIMELIQGPELQESRLSAGELRVCLVQVAEALRELQAKQIIHCDIKPSNILMRRSDGTPVLVDFGVALDLTADLSDFRLFGTPYYMAPEALRHGSPSFAWDAYGLGVTAASLLGVRMSYDNLEGLKDAKRLGEFYRALRAGLEAVAEPRLRDWVLALLDLDAGRRIDALERSGSLLAA